MTVSERRTNQLSSCIERERASQMTNDVRDLPTVDKSSRDTPDLNELLNCLFLVFVAGVIGFLAWLVSGRDVAVGSFAATACILWGYIKAAPTKAGQDFATAHFVASWRWTLLLPLVAIALVWLGLAAMVPADAPRVSADYEDQTAAVVRGVIYLSFASVVAEEVIFRGALLRVFANEFNVGVALLGQAGVFTLMHWWTPAGIGGLRGLILFALGCLLGLLFLRTKSLYSCMVVHWCWNFGAAHLESQYVSTQTNLVVALSALSTLMWGAILAACLCAFALLESLRRERNLRPWLRSRELWPVDSKTFKQNKWDP